MKINISAEKYSAYIMLEFGPKNPETSDEQSREILTLNQTFTAAVIPESVTIIGPVYTYDLDFDVEVAPILHPVRTRVSAAEGPYMSKDAMHPLFPPGRSLGTHLDIDYLLRTDSFLGLYRPADPESTVQTLTELDLPMSPHFSRHRCKEEWDNGLNEMLLKHCDALVFSRIDGEFMVVIGGVESVKHLADLYIQLFGDKISIE